MLSLMEPLVSRIPLDSPNSAFRDVKTGEGRIRLASKFNSIEHELQAAQPSLQYDQLLAQGYIRLAQDLGFEVTEEIQKEAKEFGGSIGSWPAFPDTVNACQRLSKHFKLIPLTNVDNQSFGRTLAGPLKGVDFSRVYTAQDIGSYKPDLRNFEYLLKHAKEDVGAEKDEILHVAQSIFHDHVPVSLRIDSRLRSCEPKNKGRAF